MEKLCSTRVDAKSPIVTSIASPPGLARSRSTMARDVSMPCTGTPRPASGSEPPRLEWRLDFVKGSSHGTTFPLPA